MFDTDSFFVIDSVRLTSAPPSPRGTRQKPDKVKLLANTRSEVVRYAHSEVLLASLAK